MLALGMLGIGMMLAPGAVFAQNTNVAANSDDDEVEQENKSEIKQESETKCEAEAGSANIAGVAVGDQISGASASNDCDTTQNAVVVQSNTNEDNDVQIADAEQSVCEQLAVLGLQICGNEEED